MKHIYIVLLMLAGITVSIEFIAVAQNNIEQEESTFDKALQSFQKQAEEAQTAMSTPTVNDIDQEATAAETQSAEQQGILGRTAAWFQEKFQWMWGKEKPEDQWDNEIENLFQDHPN